MHTHTHARTYRFESETQTQTLIRDFCFRPFPLSAPSSFRVRCLRQTELKSFGFAYWKWSHSRACWSTRLLAVSFAVAIGGWKWIFMSAHSYYTDVCVWVCPCIYLVLFIEIRLTYFVAGSSCCWCGYTGNGKTGNRRLKHINTLKLSSFMFFYLTAYLKYNTHT